MYNTFHYTLRRTLPPWSFHENLRELEEAVVQGRLDEVLVKVDTEEFSHGQVNPTWFKAYLPLLAELKAMLDRHGVLFSINPWITLCHLDRGRRGEDSFAGFRGMVDIDGGVSGATACPLCVAWQEHTRAIWQDYARLKPHSIWVEDDLRYLNHTNIKFGCFCEEHLARFGKWLGLATPPRREEVRAAIFAVGEPHPWRRQWLEFLGSLYEETVAFLAGCVHEIDPAIRIGYMTSGLRVHTAEGRDWDGFRKVATTGGTTGFLSRPNFGAYAEVVPHDLYHSDDQARLTRVGLAGAEAELAEVENIPYTRVARSVASTRAQVLLTALCGCHGAAMNLYDHFGNPMEGGDKFNAMLAALKPRVAAIGAAIRRPGRDGGVNVAFSQDYAKYVHLKEENYIGLFASGEQAAYVLGTTGVPHSYDDTAAVTYLTGQMPRAFTDAQLKTWLGKSLWLDAVAARILLERGFGHLIGLEGMEAARPPETYHNGAGEEFLPSTRPPRYASLYAPCYGPNARVSLLHPAVGATLFSQAVDCDCKPLGCIGLVYENSLGGRVFVHGFDYDPYAANIGFMGTRRLEGFRRVVDFLDPKAEILRVTGDGVQPLPVQRELADGSVLLGFMNITYDAWERVELRCAALARHATAFVLEGGEWQPLAGYAPKGDTLLLNRTVPPMEALLLWLK